MTSLGYPFPIKSEVLVLNPPQQQKNLGIAEATTIRHVESTWYPPLDLTAEQHMPSERTGIIMRHQLAALQKQARSVSLDET